MSQEECKNPSMSGKETNIKDILREKREFGFVVEQTVNKWTPRTDIEKSINNFFDEMKDTISRRCHIKKDSIQTDTHYDGRRKVLQGLCFVPKEISESVIDQLYYTGKAVWRSQPSEPYDFFLV